MTSYNLVKNMVDAKLEKYEKDGVDLSVSYARLTGELEMKIVILLDYIKNHHGDEAYDDAVERVMM